ncbi:PQQ-dependent sugar dehydrogenase [Haloferula chungangensis]|uniref:PQQ-dependent sugar dehydrogenase n=1 Tax=Haloferula chungangensis TaxID=1048331 RepID=A0ABW2LAF5_9BACT
MKRLLPFLIAPVISQAADEVPDYKTMKVTEVYANLCAGCHGKDMTGGQGPSLIDGEWKHGDTDNAIFQTILKGNLDFGMTPWEGILTDKQIRSLVILIREKEKEAIANGINFPEPEVGKVVETELEKYQIEMVVNEGLEIPWAISFLPDGRKLITEKEGRLRIVGSDGKLDPKAIEGTPEVLVHGQGGLMDVAVHPDYEENGWIYLAYADGWRDKPEKKGKEGKANAITAIARGRIKGHQWVDHEEIWKADKKFYTSAGVHFGTRIVFDNGYVYFIVGERGGNMEAQDLKNPKGKIYRLFDDGSEPKDNPFYGKPGVAKGTWTYGHRNPQGMDIDPRDGSLYITEHGPRGGDELNWIRPGLNYGWPVITYGMNYNGTPLSDITEKEGMEQPVTHWTPSIATCGLAFYKGDQFPAWQNDLFVGALKQQELRRLRLKDREVTSQEVILKNIGRVRDVKTGPDGFLYVVLNDPDKVIRLAPAK